MDVKERSLDPSAPSGLTLVPIHGAAGLSPVKICLVIQPDPDPISGTFVLLREVPGARVYLGALCDAGDRVQEWVEIWVQELELREVAFSNHQEPLDNATFDRRWEVEFERALSGLPETVIVTGMERENPRPLLVQTSSRAKGMAVVELDPIPWQLCKDDGLLTSCGLPPYSSSSYRYLFNPAAGKAAALVATASDAPTNAHVQTPEKALGLKDGVKLFNLHAGLIRVTRFSPLNLEEYLQILEGRPWNGPVPRTAQLFDGGIYPRLQAWSGTPKGLPFLLHHQTASADRLMEVFLLKASALLGLLKAVRASVKAQQLPLLNLTPDSFRVTLPDVGDQFPALWAAKLMLVKPGQAYLLKIRFTEQKYFVRLGRTEPSPFLPEGLGAHSFGIGSVRVRNVVSERDGVMLEGTLVAEDYLGLNSHDMLWFKLPLGEERLEFYAHVYASESVGPKEARFRTVPAQHSEGVIASLKRAIGTAFQRSPYEIWPLLSSPCDLYSLGVLATRILLSNSQSNLPVILDEVLSLAQRIGKESKDGEGFGSQLALWLRQDERALDLVSPHALMECGDTAKQARSKIDLDLWIEAIGVLVRLFPGISRHSFCQSFGDVSPLALETVFHRPIEELESLVCRIRSALLPSHAANYEIASVLLEQLSNLEAANPGKGRSG